VGLLSDQYEYDRQAYLDTDGFAETVTYTPRGGDAREISAVVNRKPRRRADESGRFYQPRCEVSVANDATTGIAVADGDTIGGKIVIDPGTGVEPQTMLVIQHDNIIGQDGGMLDLLF
jgi:hypothetical protein